MRLLLEADLEVAVSVATLEGVTAGVDVFFRFGRGGMGVVAVIGAPETGGIRLVAGWCK